ncbi:ribosome maturation factor RimP [Microbispora sp. GKU 823]|uniref:ribosome maturation factor RimP n=1 Tax=Microbispora sp. GKU 823 TaxID=1652100 RepID=UPI0009A45FDB|nr:ribosome maturation factor RimP [Microbispora sp. GKU 823]OPG04853.1 ribosome maturation factor RimP [Microbispora sp. GKU 823]
MGSDARRGRLVELLGPVVAAEGFDLEDVTVTPAGRRRLVRVVVDRDGGVSLDDVADVSQSVSKRLDEVDVLGGSPYVLEVTSPGVDRPLTEPRHWRRARGRLVKAELRDGTSAEGRVTEADETGVELDGARRIAYDELVRGRVQVEFNRREAGLDDELDEDLDVDEDIDDADDEG